MRGERRTTMVRRRSRTAPSPFIFFITTRRRHDVSKFRIIRFLPRVLHVSSAVTDVTPLSAQMSTSSSNCLLTNGPTTEPRCETALGILGYSLAVLRLFDRKFYAQLTLFLSLNALHLIISVGLIYAALVFLLSVYAFLRARHSRHDYADRNDSGDTTNTLTIRTVWTGSQTIVRAAIRDCRMHRSLRCLHCCRNGGSHPCSSSPAINPRLCLNIVTIGSLETNSTHTL